MAEEREADIVIPKAFKRRRTYYGLVYFFTFISGWCALIDPSKLIIDQVSLLVASLFGVSMIVAAACCFFSSVTDLWIGEFSGLPLLASAAGLYGGAAVFSAFDDYQTAGPILVGYGLLMVSFAILLMIRWFDVRLIKVNAEKQAREEDIA